MTGFIHITGRDVPEGLAPEEAHAAFGFEIEASCILDSRLEAITLAFNVCRSLGFDRADYEVLHMLSENPEGLQQYEFRLGGIMNLDEEDPHD